MANEIKITPGELLAKYGSLAIQLDKAHEYIQTLEQRIKELEENKKDE
jgi:uncharacterized protein YukE